MDDANLPAGLRVECKQSHTRLIICRTLMNYATDRYFLGVDECISEWGKYAINLQVYCLLLDINMDLSRSMKH